jgi:hypothetical protein
MLTGVPCKNNIWGDGHTAVMQCFCCNMTVLKYNEANYVQPLRQEETFQQLIIL